MSCMFIVFIFVLYFMWNLYCGLLGQGSFAKKRLVLKGIPWLNKIK